MTLQILLYYHSGSKDKVYFLSAIITWINCQGIPATLQQLYTSSLNM